MSNRPIAHSKLLSKGEKYSDLPTIFMQYILEEKYKTTLENLFIERISNPLNLQSTFYLPLKYRDKSEITKARINDNLLKLEKELSEETVKNIKNQVQLDIQEAVDFAESSEFPKESELLENVYG